jgi:hypoxanthine phosphoribosyltransferase
MGQMLENMRPFITDKEIQEMVRDLAKQIERDYQDQELVLICPLKGSALFMADLMRQLRNPMEVDFVQLISPKRQDVKIIKDISVDIADRHVLVIEEIIDAGRTLSFLKKRLLASNPASLRIVTLLDKPARRELALKPDYVGRTIDDRYVIGYGMDSEEIGRNYRDIYNFTQ